MPKAQLGFDPATYAPVADRINLFFEAYPDGRIVTELITRSERDVVFKAMVFRRADDAQPSATGWAAEREGDGDVNVVACLENTETSAVGRALANLGFTASRERPSAEEMIKAARVRARYAQRAVPVRAVREARPVSDEPLQRRANIVMDLIRLLKSAERAGLRAIRGQRWRAQLLVSEFDEALLTEIERRLRAWVARQPHSA
jgi:hypothetical protein